MEELQSTLIEWVRTSKINSSKLSKKCNKLGELSDGILLFEFMSKVYYIFSNSSYFDISCLSLAPNNNWALKLANLKKLKKAVISYIDQELKLPYKRFDSIDLSNIARKEETKDLLALVELTIFATVNSPYKEEFIKTIMELDEECQTQFMYFIQKAIGACDSPLYDPNIKVENREVLILRTEKQRLTVNIQELEEEIKGYKNKIQKITQEKEELGLVVTDLRSELSRKPKIDLKEFSADSNEFELRLTEKDIKIMQLSNLNADLKSSTEKEINKLRDELDVANNKVFQLSQSEKTLQQYKKRLESLSSVKIKLQDLEKQNEELLDQLEIKDAELETLSSLKRSIKSLKDEIAAERNNTECLSYKLEVAKKDLKKKESESEDYKQRLYSAENRIRDLESERHESSEDSVIYNKLPEFEETGKTGLEIRREKRQLTINTEMDQIRKEKLIFMHKYKKNKDKNKENSENLSMIYEEMTQRKVETSQKIKQLESQLLAMTAQLQIMSENMAGAQKDKFKYEQCVYELEQVKISKESLMGEIKGLYEEKDQMYKKLIDCREEVMSIQNVVNDKETQLRQREITEKILNEKLQALVESEQMLTTGIENLKKQKHEDSNDYMIKFMETERELITLKSEKSGLLFRIAEKDERIEEILKDKAETIRILERKHKETLDGIKEENNRRTNQIISQCDDAITELQKDRELVVAQLKIEKQNALQEWKNSMGLEWTQSNKGEIAKLKEEILKKDKEIAKLSRNVQEIKKCWKHSSRLLKAVWKELGVETQKMQNATKRYIT